MVAGGGEAQSAGGERFREMRGHPGEEGTSPVSVSSWLGRTPHAGCMPRKLGRIPEGIPQQGKCTGRTGLSSGGSTILPRERKEFPVLVARPKEYPTYLLFNEREHAEVSPLLERLRASGYELAPME